VNYLAVRLTFLSVLFAICFVPIRAQSLAEFKAMSTYSKEDVNLLDRLKIQIEEEMSRTSSTRRDEINRVYRAIGKRLRLMVAKNEFIRDTSLQQFVQATVQKLVAANHLKFPPKLILIQNSATVNALSAADGTLIIYVGLLSKIDNESQLAFVLAHEMAHFELQHVRQRITESIEDELMKKEVQNLKDLAGNDDSSETMENLKKIWYYQGVNSRARERKADSLAFEMMDNAGFALSEAISILTILDQSKLPKTDLDFMMQLDLPHYPLKDEWLRKRPSIFSRSAESVFFEKDSIVSHPDLELRMKMLARKIVSLSGELNYQSKNFLKEMVLSAWFQSIESTFVKEDFDQCLYLALKLRERYPTDSYLTLTIAKVFAGLYERKSFDYDFYLVLPKYTVGYNDELRIVNEFLHNMKQDEYGEMAYSFLSYENNFNPTSAEHYQLLWDICSMTNHIKERKEIKKAYNEKLEDRKFKGKMILYTPYKTKLKKKIFIVNTH